MTTLTPSSIQPAELTKDSIKQLLLTSDRAVYRALVVLYERQTSDEQASATTTHKNGRGFSSFDAEFLTSLTQQYQRRGCLSPKQIACARKKVVHYTGQLLEAAEAKRAVGTQVALPLPDAPAPARKTFTSGGRTYDVGSMKAALYPEDHD